MFTALQMILLTAIYCMPVLIALAVTDNYNSVKASQNSTYTYSTFDNLGMSNVHVRIWTESGQTLLKHVLAMLWSVEVAKEKLGDHINTFWKWRKMNDVPTTNLEECVHIHKFHSFDKKLDVIAWNCKYYRLLESCKHNLISKSSNYRNVSWHVSSSWGIKDN